MILLVKSSEVFEHFEHQPFQEVQLVRFSELIITDKTIDSQLLNDVKIILIRLILIKKLTCENDDLIQQIAQIYIYKNLYYHFKRGKERQANQTQGIYQRRIQDYLLVNQYFLYLLNLDFLYIHQLIMQ